MEKLNILVATIEAIPFVHVTNAAEFVYNTTRKYKEENHNAMVVMPLYNSIKKKYSNSLRYITNFMVDMNYEKHTASILTLDVEGVQYLFIDSETYFNRNRIYGEHDDCERFIFFSKAVVQMIKEMDLKPDIVNVKDFQTALIPAYIKKAKQNDNFYKNIKTVITLHDIKNQGIYPVTEAESIALPMDMVEDYDYKFYNSVNFLKAGIMAADYITFPSATFKDECQSPYYSEKLDGLFKANNYKMAGVVDGLNYIRYNPETDGAIFANFSVDTIEDRAINKTGLLNYYNLMDADRMLVCVIGRMISRKGVDLIVDNLEYMMEKNINIIFMGTGDPEIEDSLIEYQNKYPEHIAVKLYTNENEAVRTFAGSDFYLAAPKIEMNAINQLIAMRYGSVPIVRETGTLKDTVKEYNKFSKKGEGILFTNQTSRDFRKAIDKACEIYFDKHEIYSEMQKNCMMRDSRWSRTTDIYLEIFNELRNEFV